jgi:Ca-activated chloride channel family protein
MERRQLLRNILAAGAVSFAPGIFPFQPPGKEDQTEFTLRSDVRLVLLDVAVKDSKGAFVGGLVKDNFFVTEDGHSQQISVFAHDDIPATVGILVDESYSMRPRRSDVLHAADTFIDLSNPRDEIFVLNFNDTVQSGLPRGTMFSSDPKKLRAALQGGLPRGRTALNDAVVLGLNQLRLGHHERKALLLISDGGDNASNHTRQQMLTSVETIPATVYTIGLFDEEDPDRAPGLLRQIAFLSGGQCFLPQTSAETTPVCGHIAEDIRARYTVGFVPRVDGDTGRIRRLRVSVKAPGREKLTAVARTSYRYDREATDVGKT